jgi:hypothetical protein
MKDANPMTQADCVYITPPTNTPIDTHRRHFLAVAAGASIVSVGALTAAANPAGAPDATSAVDPIYAAIEKHKALTAPFDAAWKARGRCKDFGTLTEDEKQHIRKLNDAIDKAALPMEQAACELFDTVPTTPAGIVAAIRVIQTYYALGDDNGHMPNGEWLYDDEDDPQNGRDWLECFLDTIAQAVESLAIRGVA